MKQVFPGYRKTRYVCWFLWFWDILDKSHWCIHCLIGSFTYLHYLFIYSFIHKSTYVYSFIHSFFNANISHSFLWIQIHHPLNTLQDLLPSLHHLPFFATSAHPGYDFFHSHASRWTSPGSLRCQWTWRWIFFSMGGIVCSFGMFTYFY